jgi:FdhD protein
VTRDPHERLARFAGGIVRQPVVRYAGGAPSSGEDEVIVEAPLEIRVRGERLAVTMRTPGHDAELALGLLVAEGLLEKASDVASVDPWPDGDGIDVVPHAGIPIDLSGAAARRGTLTTAACGVCGRQTIDDLLARIPQVTDETRWAPDAIARLPELLRTGQAQFSRTGGLHGAAAVGADGQLRCVREDVGRHNAIDKVLGRLLLDGALPASASALVVSGRAGFEIVQKAVMGGFSLIVSVSAPSSIAIATAERAGATLVGFARGETFNVYTGAARIG